ncbi:MAG TPA: helix-turn-helix domain-containing protein [Edaphocola sp.]|nr:helix-turn-helix domain-containing protein [Edaphocola sp.]
MANALLLLKDKFRQNAEGPFTIRITREDLANLSGTTTGSLMRTLSDFRSEKILDIRNGNIEILNEKKLAGMIN